MSLRHGWLMLRSVSSLAAFAVVLLAPLTLAGQVPPASRSPGPSVPAARDQDEAVLRTGGIGLSTSELLRLVGRQVSRPGDAARAQQLVQKLGSDSFEERQRADHDLRALGVVGLPALRMVTENADLEVARRAKEIVSLLEREAAHENAALKVLVRRQEQGTVQKLLRLGDARIQQATLRCVEDMGLRDMDVCRAVLEALRDGDDAVTAAAWHALAITVLPQALPDLVRLSQHESPRVRAGAIGVMFKFKDKPDVTVPILLKALKDPSARVRRMAAGMGRHFWNAPEMITALIAATGDAERGDPSAPHHLPGTVACLAVESLASAPEPATEALAALVRAAKSDDRELRRYALISLGRLGRKADALARQVLPHLLPLLASKDVRDRYEALASIYQMGPRGQGAVPSLLRALRASDIKEKVDRDVFRRQVLSTLAALGPGASAAVPELIKVVGEEGWTTDHRTIAIVALARVGPAARRALPELRKASEGKDPSLATTASRAIEVILESR